MKEKETPFQGSLSRKGIADPEGLKMGRRRRVRKNVNVVRPGDPPAGRVCQRRRFWEAGKDCSLTCASFSRVSIAARSRHFSKSYLGQKCPALSEGCWSRPLGGQGFLGVVVFTRTPGSEPLGKAAPRLQYCKPVLATSPVSPHSLL